ncbi:unnamed protein product, partial [Trichobilharzia szidati]
IFIFVPNGEGICKYRWAYLGLTVVLACLYVTWVVILRMKTPLVVNIVFAVITNILMSVFCGMVTTCFDVKWCLTSLALATVFAVLIFLAAIYMKSFTLLNYKFLFICSGILGAICIVLIISSALRFPLKITAPLFACVILLLAVFIFTIVQLIWDEKTKVTQGGSIFFAS